LDIPGETFRVLKEKEERMYGEYRMPRLVLEESERLQKDEGERMEGELGRQRREGTRSLGMGARKKTEPVVTSRA
jgi:hypothetical protein